MGITVDPTQLHLQLPAQSQHHHPSLASAINANSANSRRLQLSPRLQNKLKLSSRRSVSKEAQTQSHHHHHNHNYHHPYQLQTSREGSSSKENLPLSLARDEASGQSLKKKGKEKEKEGVDVDVGGYGRASATASSDAASSVFTSFPKGSTKPAVTSASFLPPADSNQNSHSTSRSSSKDIALESDTGEEWEEDEVEGQVAGLTGHPVPVPVPRYVRVRVGEGENLRYVRTTNDLRVKFDAKTHGRGEARREAEGGRAVLASAGGERESGDGVDSNIGFGAVVGFGRGDSADVDMRLEAEGAEGESEIEEEESRHANLGAGGRAQHVFVRFPPPGLVSASDSVSYASRERAILQAALQRSVQDTSTSTPSSSKVSVTTARLKYHPPSNWEASAPRAFVGVIRKRGVHAARNESPAERYLRMLEGAYGAGDVLRGEGRKPP